VETKLIALLVVTLLVLVLGIALMFEMFRRDEATLGATALGILMFGAVLAIVYGTLDTT
jgi:hypothetical protein